MYDFESIGADGNIFINMNRWRDFTQHKMNEYPHNWLHRRLLVLLHSPRNDLGQIPLPQIFNFLPPPRTIVQNTSSDWSVIFDVYPAYTRTDSDPEGKLPSHRMFLENKHPKPTYGEPVVLFGTGEGFGEVQTRFAFFRGLFWFCEEMIDYGLGTSEPTLEDIQRVGTKKKIYRSIDDESVFPC